jgi:hypothetical protein
MASNAPPTVQLPGFSRKLRSTFPELATVTARWWEVITLAFLKVGASRGRLVSTVVGGLVPSGWPVADPAV